MSSNIEDLIISARQQFHISSRKQIDNLKNQKKRIANGINLHKIINANIMAQNRFSQESFTTLMNIIDSDTTDQYIMLGNYMCDYIQQTAEHVFHKVKMIKSNNTQFSWVVRLSLQSNDVSYQEIAHHIDSFLCSEDPQTFKNGLICISLMIQKRDVNTLNCLSNLRSALDYCLSNKSDQSILLLSSNILMDLLCFQQTRHKIFSSKTTSHLIYFLNKSKKYRERALNVLVVLYSDFQMHMQCANLMHELIVIYYNQTSNLLPLLSDVWIKIIEYQSVSFIKQCINLGFKNIICMKLQSQDTNVVFKSLQVLSKLFEILDISDQKVFVANLLKYMNMNFQLDVLLQDLENHSNQKVSNMASQFYSDYYSVQNLQEFV